MARPRTVRARRPPRPPRPRRPLIARAGVVTARVVVRIAFVGLLAPVALVVGVIAPSVLGSPRLASATTGPMATGPTATGPAASAPAPSRPPPGHVYRPPVDGPIIDHFRPPACSWCPGNRGIDYAVPPGTPVRASAAGVVTFAGAIGRQRFVTVLHADGLRTSYAFLATVEVRAGQVVAQGDVVGTSGVSVHFGVRRGTVYLDPELLLDGWRPVARLVPTDGGPGRASGAAPCASPARPCVSPARPLAASERGRSAPDGPCGGSATMTSRPASGEPLDHERPATCGRPPGRGRARHQNRRKET